jgi:lysophospholipase L1-like esterase
MPRLSRFTTAVLVFVLSLLVLLSACGGRTGSTAPGNWRYTALGDSLAFGALAQQGYVPRYADYIRTDTGSTVDVTNLGVPGWHSSDLLNAVRTDPAFRTAISNSQVVTWDIGGNDLANAYSHFTDGSCGGPDNQDCLRTAVSDFTANWDAVVSELLTLRSPQQTILRTMDIYNPFVAPAAAAGTFATLETYLDEVNAHIHTSAAANGIPVANVHQAFNGPDGTQDPISAGLIAADNFHPNDAGHKVIADQLRALGYAPLH